ncbi:MAG: hypothetical protein V3S55_09965 [Nitrospiraceae bacterium]
MPGRPKLLALRKRIAEEDLEDEIFEAVAEGLSITKVCEQFQITSRKMFYDWKGKEGPRQDKYTAARLIAGEVHAEKAGEILDKLGEPGKFITGPDVSLATARSKYQQWLAGVKDRDQFGPQDKGATLNLNFGDQHFEALMSPGARPHLSERGKPDPLVPIQEAEFVELENVGAGNDGEAEAQSGITEGPITPPAPTLAPELVDLL